MRRKMFVPLHAKSDYSLGYGTASIDELVERAAELGYTSLALTDLENLYGQVRFHDKCRQHGIRPISGVELRPGFDGRRNPGTRARRLVLLAENDKGYGNLCRIVSRRRGGVSGGALGGADPVDVAKPFSEGLFALSDDPAVVERLLSSFPPDRVGLLVVRPTPPSIAGNDREAVETASGLGVRLVADLDVLFLHRVDYHLHLLQLAIAQGRQMGEIAKGDDVERRDATLRAPADAAPLFSDIPDALEAAAEIAALCHLDLGVKGEHPSKLGEDERDAEKLRQLCQKALTQILSHHPVSAEEYRNRLDQELEVFGRLGFSGFMLTVAEILIHCRENGILVAVRGSAVSSLVLHLLGGSPVDPIAEGLLFERFLHAQKSAWPDVDFDLPWDRRDEVIDWVYRKFGEEKVAMVATHRTFRLRSAVREGLKAWGAPAEVVEAVSHAIPPEDLLAEEVDFLDVAQEGGAIDFTKEIPAELVGKTPELKSILPLILRLVGRPRHIAVHPGGIVIEVHPLDGMVPLERAPKGVVVTQYDLVSVAKVGLVKIDLLGNRCLSEIEEALPLAGWQKPLRLDSIPADDPPTLRLIDSADTVGCFQLESPAMRSLLARLPIRRQSDLVASLALIRPGAAAGEVKNTFARRARGEEKWEGDLALPDHPLQETYALPIYEEQIMALLSSTGGITLAQADELRRGIVKSGADKGILSSLQSGFLDGARLAFPDDKAALAKARRAWSVAARFAAYSFNKAHAASYALLAYYSAYLKVHHPVEFGCALLNHHEGLYPLRVEAAELIRMGVQLLRPHVNYSEIRTSCVTSGSDGSKILRVGLDKIRSLSRRAAAEIVAERVKGGGYRTVGDLLTRVRLRVHETAALVLSGACDELPPLRSSEYPFIHEAVVQRLREKCQPGELDAVAITAPAPPTPADRERIELYRALVRARNELIYLGMHLSAHPMALLRGEARRYQCLPIEEAIRRAPDSTVRIAAVVAAMRRVVTRQGPMQFITFDDETALLEAVVFPVVYRRLGERVTTPGPFLVVGKLRNQQGAVHLEVGRLEPFHERERAYRR